MKEVLLFTLLFGLVWGDGIFIEKEESLEWWETSVFYQIYPRSYADSNGDGIGDLNGITSKLDYVKELGVGALWLSPIFKSPMYDFGYDISDFYDIHDEYGTIEDFENLLAKATSLGLKVILDLVPNHSSNESMWFNEALKGNATYLDYFIWEDPIIDENGDIQPPNNWLSNFRGSAWEYRGELNKYYLHQFVVGQPDLNYRNPDVVNEMKNIIRFWLEKGVAGFRVDAVNFLYEVDKNSHGGKYPDEPRANRIDVDAEDYEYLDHIYSKNQNETCYMVYEWRAILDEFKARDGMARIMMTEVYAPIDHVVQYYGNGYVEGAQMPFNFGLITDVDSSSSAPEIKRAIDNFLTFKPADRRPNWVVGNHDNSRMATRYGSKLVDGINMIVLLLPGVGVTYMGEEIGLLNGYVSWEDTVDPSGCNTNDPINYWKKSRDPERTPFQWNAEKNAGFSTANKTWLPVAENYVELNVEAQKAATKSNLKTYQALIKLRQDKVFQRGRFDSMALNTDVFAFKRWYKNSIYIVVVNLRDAAHTVDLTFFENVTGQVHVVLPSLDSSKKVGETYKAAALDISSYEALVLRVK